MRIVIQHVRGDTAARARLLPPGYREREGLADGVALALVGDGTGAVALAAVPVGLGTGVARHGAARVGTGDGGPAAACFPLPGAVSEAEGATVPGVRVVAGGALTVTAAAT